MEVMRAAYKMSLGLLFVIIVIIAWALLPIFIISIQPPEPLRFSIDYLK